MNANARIVSELAHCWAALDNKVCIITSQPNFPQGRIFPGYKNSVYQKSTDDALSLIRVKTYMAPNTGVLKRAWDFLSFGFSSFIAGLFCKDYDVIVGISPQFICVVSACFLSILKRKPFVFILCDLWPDAIVSTGALENNILIRILKRIEIFLYKKSKLIVTLSPYFNKYLIESGINENKILLSLSGVNTQFFFPTEKDHDLIGKYKLQDKFVVGYVGTMGLAHNHDDLLDIAESLLIKRQNNIHFVFIGDGARKSDLQKIINEKSLTNANIDGPIQLDEIPKYWSITDLSLVVLKDIPSNKTVVPSKMLEAMAMGKPILLYAPEGEAKNLLEESGSGVYVQAGRKDDLEKKILELAGNKELLNIFKQQSILFSKRYSRESQAKEIINRIKALTSK
jgi:glycosyltransferase involved in cell wall biosynthesis